MSKPIVVLSAGHGGNDSGVVAGNRLEKDANLEAVLTMKWWLTLRGWDVRLTRSGDTYPPLAWRAQMAERVNALAFVSVHHNSVGAGSMVYRSAHPASLVLAREWARLSGYGEDRVWTTDRSRFRRLYVDDAGDRASVLLELDSIDRAPAPGPLGAFRRLVFARRLERALQPLRDA